jgi:hypothetical protein
VSGKDIKIAVEGLYIDLEPRRCLAAVDQHLRTVPVGEPGDGLDRHERTRRIGEVGHRDEPGSGRQKRLEGGQVQTPGRIDRRHDEPNADAVAQ